MGKNESCPLILKEIRRILPEFRYIFKPNCVKLDAARCCVSAAAGW